MDTRYGLVGILTDEYKRVLTLSREKTSQNTLEYVVKVDPSINLESSSVSKINSPHPFQPLIQMMMFIEEGELYEREQYPDYDEDLNPLDRRLDLTIKVDSSYIKDDNKIFDQLRYLARLFGDREDLETFVRLEDPSGNIHY